MGTCRRPVGLVCLMGGGGGLVLRGKGVAVGQACQVAYRILLL